MKKMLMASVVAGSLIVLSSQAQAAKNTLPDLENAKWVNNLSYQIDSQMMEGQHTSRIDIYVGASPKDRRNIWVVYTEENDMPIALPLVIEDPNKPSDGDILPEPEKMKKIMRLGRYQYLGLIETVSKMPAKWETVVYDQIGLCDAPSKAVSFQGHAQAVTSLCISPDEDPEMSKVSPAMSMLISKMGRVMKRVKRFGKSPEPVIEEPVLDDAPIAIDTKAPELSDGEQDKERDQIARRPSRAFLGFRR